MRRNGGIALQCQPNFIDPVQQAMFAEWVDFKFEPVLKRRRHRLRFQINMEWDRFWQLPSDGQSRLAARQSQAGRF